MTATTLDHFWVYAPKAPGLVSEGQRPGNSAPLDPFALKGAKLGAVLPFQGVGMLVGRVTRALPFADDWVHLWCETNHRNARTIAEQGAAANRSQAVRSETNGTSSAAG